MKRIVAILCLLTINLSCSANTNLEEEDSLEPALSGVLEKTGSGLQISTASINKDLKKKGLRALVIFAKVEINVEPDPEKRPILEEHYCPVKVRTVDSACDQIEYSSVDPSVICRAANGAKDEHGQPVENSLTRIKWVSRKVDGLDMPFTVIFKGAQKPCRGTWTGKSPGTKHVCKLQDASVLGVEAGKSGYFKYDIIGYNQLGQKTVCPTLDPYFIARH